METEKQKQLFDAWFRLYSYRTDKTTFGRLNVETYYKRYKQLGGYHSLDYLKTHSPVREEVIK